MRAITARGMGGTDMDGVVQVQLRMMVMVALERRNHDRCWGLAALQSPYQYTTACGCRGTIA